MKVAILSAVRNSWNDVPAYLSELRSALARHSSGADASIWLIDDAAEARPQSWHSLDAGGGELHVIELQGRQGRDRAFATALGYLICEREESYDAFVLVDVRGPAELRNIESLFETALHNPGCVVLAPGGPARGGLAPRISYRASRLFLRALSGEALAQSPAILLPARAAEALCHSCHGASHVEAAVRHLNLETVAASSMPRGSCGLDVIAAASVFRDQVFRRAFHLAAWLFAITIVVGVAAAVELGRGRAVPAVALSVLALCAAIFGGAALVALLFGLFSRSLNEARRWTPALDSPLLVREVTRVKRQPYAVNASSGSRADRSAGTARP